MDTTYFSYLLAGHMAQSDSIPVLPLKKTKLRGNERERQGGGWEREREKKSGPGNLGVPGPITPKSSTSVLINNLLI